MIRPLDPLADRAAVARLFDHAADYVTLESGPRASAESARAFLDGDPPPGVEAGRVVRLGLEGGSGLDGIVELAFGFPEASNAFLGLLLLAPGARGRGLGRALLARVEAEARLQGAARLLVAVLDANPRGRAFWEREGFREVARFEDRRFGARLHGVARLARPVGTGRDGSGS